jgi:hypothetical protein
MKQSLHSLVWKRYLFFLDFLFMLILSATVRRSLHEQFFLFQGHGTKTTSTATIHCQWPCEVPAIPRSMHLMIPGIDLKEPPQYHGFDDWSLRFKVVIQYFGRKASIQRNTTYYSIIQPFKRREVTQTNLSLLSKPGKHIPRHQIYVYQHYDWLIGA